MKRFPAPSIASGLMAAALWLAGSPALAQPDGSFDRSGKTYTPLDQAPFGSPFDPAYSPYEEMRRIQREMDEYVARQLEAFQNFTPVVPPPPSFSGWNVSPGLRRSQWQSAGPSMNVSDEGDHYLVELNIPERQQNNVKVKLEGLQLTVSGTHNEETDRTDPGMRSRRVFSSSFSQSVTLPGAVRQEKMKVERGKDGLKVILPKA